MMRRWLLTLGLLALGWQQGVWALPFSPGDRLEVSIPNEKYFAGVYVVNQVGVIEVPFLGPVAVEGLERAAVEEKLHQLLTDQGYFPPDKLQLSVQVLQWAPVQVTVAGEVFQPGRVLIENPGEPSNEITVPPESQSVTGDYPFWRYGINALRAVGGVLPTADVANIVVQRGEEEIPLDLSGVFTGDAVADIPLMAGDRLVVPSTGQVQPALARPSQITPPGIKVFISNLTVPANSNATSAVGNQQEGITFPYGARFSQAVVAANCVGGTANVNANRRAILVRVDTASGATLVTEKPVEELVRNSHSNTDNPLLMPRDAIACYDSGMTNTRDIFRSITDLLSPLDPFLIFRNLFFR
ncbi:polysaccharide biosynthesis/export family protein [Synechocystis sp. PCC 7338]|nr:polysaccharide biosynthesis/export family protein [Synechocystis sp. PCC 7338]